MEVRRLLSRDDVVPGMIEAIQIYGELLHWHPHLHALATGGAFTPAGEFVKLPELDLQRLEAAWQEAVFALYVAEEKVEPEVVENMRTWQQSDFSVDQLVFLTTVDQVGIERLIQYMTPFPLNSLFPPCRFRSVGGNQIFYQFSVTRKDPPMRCSVLALCWAAIAVQSVACLLDADDTKSEDSLRVGLRKQLFVDDRLIATMSNLTRELGQVTKANKGTPLLVADKPWEKVSLLRFGSVLLDGDRFRMWYGMNDHFLGYAESDDGLSWTKPSLGVHEF